MYTPSCPVPAASLILSLVAFAVFPRASDAASEQLVRLPKPRRTGPLSVEQALSQRRSVRAFTRDGISLEELSQLLWAAQGVTSDRGLRTAPSAGALYPLRVYVVASKVAQLEPGIYQYDPLRHALEERKGGDLRKGLAAAALRQGAISEAAASLVITGAYERTAGKYGQRAPRYVHIEVGHVGQNVYLQAEALGLGTVAVGAFDDEKVQEILGVLETPLYIMPIGRKPR